VGESDGEKKLAFDTTKSEEPAPAPEQLEPVGAEAK
jgi:hypothetical protein